MSGQAAVAVAVSGVQVFSAVASVWGQSRETISTYVSNGEPEERSAFIFFSLSTVFLIVSAAAHGWLVTMPAYKTVAGSLEHQKVVNENGSSDELRGLVSTGRNELSDEKGQILRVAKANSECRLNENVVVLNSRSYLRGCGFLCLCRDTGKVFFGHLVGNVEGLLWIGCFPRYHNVNSTHQSRHSPSLVQRRTFSCV
jgi:hypothetical protein